MGYMAHPLLLYPVARDERDIVGGKWKSVTDIYIEKGMTTWSFSLLMGKLKKYRQVNSSERKSINIFHSSDNFLYFITSEEIPQFH